MNSTEMSKPEAEPVSLYPISEGVEHGPYKPTPGIADGHINQLLGLSKAVTEAYGRDSFTDQKALTEGMREWGRRAIDAAASDTRFPQAEVNARASVEEITSKHEEDTKSIDHNRM